MSHEDDMREDAARGRHAELMIQVEAIYELLKLILDAITTEQKNFMAHAVIREKAGLDP